jgi:hypothetical protein
MAARPQHRARTGGQGRDRTGDLSLFRRTLVPTELPGPSAGPTRSLERAPHGATLTGLEPATSAVTGRRANQLRHRAMHRPTYRTAPASRTEYPQRDSNPCYRRERAGSWAARRWGLDRKSASNGLPLGARPAYDTTPGLQNALRSVDDAIGDLPAALPGALIMAICPRNAEDARTAMQCAIIVVAVGVPMISWSPGAARGTSRRPRLRDRIRSDRVAAPAPERSDPTPRARPVRPARRSRLR